MATSNPLAATRGHTIVTHLELVVNRTNWAADLRLRLAATESPGSSEVEVVFEDVSDLSLREIGGGLSQLLYLEAEDLSAEQMDRVIYRVKEVERETLSLACRKIRVTTKEATETRAEVA